MIVEVFNPVCLDETKNKIVQSRIKVLNVSSMGMYKFLITIGSKQEAEAAMVPGHDGLRNIFDEIISWSPEETCQTRRV